MHRPRTVQTQEGVMRVRKRTLSRAQCLYEAVKAVVQTYYLTRHVTAALWQTKKQKPLQDSTEQWRARHRGDTNPNVIHTLWQPASE